MGAIQEIFQEYYKEYEKTHTLPKHARDAANKIKKCRTAALGGHVQACPEEHYQRIWYNSCKHRACTQCSGIQIEEWLEKQRVRLLDIDHFHVVFTIPHQLNELWLLNTEIMSKIFFESVKKSLFGLLKNPSFLGASPGMIATLQTWGQTLYLHPHIHCLITGGGLTDTEEWKNSNKDYLVPCKTLMEIFRGKYIDELHKLAHKNKIKRPEGMKYLEIHDLLKKLRTKNWNVRIMERYTHGEGVITYLGRYIRGGCISNKRIISIKNGEVIFKHQDNKETDEKNKAKKKTMKLKAEEFIQRFLLHIPKPGTKVVRYYGIYASSKEKSLNKCRELLGVEKVKTIKKITWQEYCEKKGEKHPEECPICGTKLIRKESIMSYYKPSDRLETIKVEKAS
ncbi:putative transposase [Alkaliphilus metalliredigens QYMF]|uniref:Putative transposase n=1 Tax=Alkaliphilus metalliredigens (strain QYMF) TaxID=293826 RepID=A6TTH3_ALKMQ|nr:IS91 family transposase [Alkaliphilus metalliredigens]ABR49491.1 putative transposase [Alkaliphilus metalliredigens QYMF]